MKKLMLLCCGFVATLCAQPQQVLFYDGSGNLQYICESRNASSQTLVTWARSDSSLTSIVIASNVATFTTAAAHQLYAGARVVVAGSTSGVIDGSFTVLSVPTSTTFTAAITAADATHTTSTITVKTTSPLLNAQYWSVTRLIYNGSNSLIGSRTDSAATKVAKCSDKGTVY